VQQSARSTATRRRELRPQKKPARVPQFRCHDNSVDLELFMNSSSSSEEFAGPRALSFHGKRNLMCAPAGSPVDVEITKIPTPPRQRIATRRPRRLSNENGPVHPQHSPPHEMPFTPAGTLASPGIWKSSSSVRVTEKNAAKWPTRDCRA